MLRRVTDWVLPEHNPAGVIFGIITIGAVLAAESAVRETYLESLGGALLVLGIYWLAHGYADLLGERLAAREHLTPLTLVSALAHSWAIVRGAGLPLLTICIAWVTGASQETAITAAVWTSVGCIVAFELLAGIRAQSTPRELALEGCVGTAMGLGILALRAIVH